MGPQRKGIPEKWVANQVSSLIALTVSGCPTGTGDPYIRTLPHERLKSEYLSPSHSPTHTHQAQGREQPGIPHCRWSSRTAEWGQVCTFQRAKAQDYKVEDRALASGSP